jgi:hypothetical protein
MRPDIILDDRWRSGLIRKTPIPVQLTPLRMTPGERVLMLTGQRKALQSPSLLSGAPP